MCKKLCFLVLSVLLLTLASASYGDVVIGNFENDMDGWGECTWEPPGYPIFSYGTNGVTLGNYSLKAVQPTENPQYGGFNWFLINTAVDADDFRANNVIAMDVTRLANEWTRNADPDEDRWSSLDMRFQDSYNFNLVSLGTYGQWDSNDPDANDTMTVTWDYTIYKDQPGVLHPSAAAVEIVMATSTGGYTGDGIWYIDNIRLLKTRNPRPRNGEWYVELNPTLKWDEVSPTETFDVYVGNDFNNVNDADRTDHPGLLFYSENQDPNNYPLSGTTHGTTYYWRVDNVVDGTPMKGDIWHFTTFLLGAEITVIGDWEQQMDGWVATNPNDPNMTLGYSTAGATLNKYSLKVEPPAQWYETVQIALNEAGFIDQLLANNRFSLDVTWNIATFAGDIESIVIEGDEIGTTQIAPISETIIGSSGNLETTRFVWNYSVIDFSLLPAEPNELTLSIGTMAEGTRGTYYFDNARFYVSKLASNPLPGDNMADVQTEPTLSWTPGEGAGTHDVYFGTDYDKVKDADRTDHPGLLFYDEDRAYDANNIDITGELGYPLSYGTTYYWRIDEVNELTWKGDVWSFTVGWYLIVDDFEDYNDLTPYKIFQTWKDGVGYSADGPLPAYNGNGTGSAVGSDAIQGGVQVVPWAEQSIVHGGSQSMPVKYVNDGSTGKALYSEIFRQWDTPQDWTVEDVKALALWFRGYPATAGSYTYSTADAGTFTVTAVSEDVFGEADDFHLIYKELTGDVLIAARVVSVEDTAEYAKAGVMIRDSLDADSTNAFVCITPEGRRSVQYRSEYKGGTEESLGDETVPIPYWVGLERSFGAFTAWYCTDGVSWEQEVVHEAVTMTDPVYIGLAYSTYSPSTFGQAVFSNVRILPRSGGVVSGDWQSQDIPNNDAEQLYVVIEDATDTNTIVEHPDPNAVLLDAWTEWPINLQDIADDGVDLENIKTMYIGVGDRDNPVSGGKGKLYFDDIRLYLRKCVPSQPAGDLNNDCMVDYLDLKAMADDWLGTGADLDENGTVDFADYVLLAQTWLTDASL